MDEVYSALDLFSNASRVAFRHEDLELEARSEAWLGKIFDKALKKEEKAMGHFTNAIRLSVAMNPSYYANTAWYKEAKLAKETIQTRRQLAEEAQRDKADAPYRKMIEEDLVKIRQAVNSKGCKDFLVFLNENYVPAERKIALTEEALQENNLKKLMTLKFAIVFHPNKNVNEPRHIQLLREDIMVHLNGFMDKFRLK